VGSASYKALISRIADDTDKHWSKALEFQGFQRSSAKRLPQRHPFRRHAAAIGMVERNLGQVRPCVSRVAPLPAPTVQGVLNC